MDRGALNWISPPSPVDVFSFFNRGTGTLPFPVLLVLALWGIVSQWHRLRDATIFALFWMYGPVLLLYATSLTITPLLVERYALSSFVPFLILAAVGRQRLPHDTRAQRRAGAGRGAVDWTHGRLFAQAAVATMGACDGTDSERTRQPQR